MPSFLSSVSWIISSCRTEVTVVNRICKRRRQAYAFPSYAAEVNSSGDLECGLMDESCCPDVHSMMSCIL